MLFNAVQCSLKGVSERSLSLCPLLRTDALLEGRRLADLLREAAFHPAPDVLCDPEITEAPRRLLPMRVKGLQDSKGISNARAKT